jgi:putative transposase
MTLPRAVIPHRCYLITRRCSERRFFMRPDKETSNAFIYCLAVSAARFGIGVIGFGTMSNHYHAVVVDNEGCFPDFLQYFHRIFAVHQNVLRGRWESFWASHEQPSVVELVRDSDLMEKLVYAITNPVKDRLVDRLEHWPGASCVPALATGKALVATRPKRYFREDGPMPPVATLELVASPLHQSMSPVEWSKTVQQQLDTAVARLREERIKSGQRVVGAKTLLLQHWNDSPPSYEPRHTMNPHVACRDKWRRIETLQRNRAFLDAYREARKAWLIGKQFVEFPAGVWAMRDFPGVKSAPPPTRC